MPEITFTPFIEEEAFTEAGIAQRLDAAQNGLNLVVQDASEVGALNHNHGGSCVVFMDTKEQTVEQLHSAQGLPAPGVTGPVYWNLHFGDGSGRGRQSPAPADGDWEAIGSPAPLSDPLEIGFSPIPLRAAVPDDRFGVTCIYVMLNAEVRYVLGQKVEQGQPGDVYNTDCGVAVTVMWEGFRMGAIPASQGFFHIYQNKAPAIDPDPQGLGHLDNWCRLPERKVGPSPGLQGAVASGIWHDISIRTTIRREDLLRAAQDLPGGTLPIDAVGKVRGAISLITSEEAQITTAMIRNANLTVIALRGVEELPL